MALVEREDLTNAAAAVAGPAAAIGRGALDRADTLVTTQKQRIEEEGFPAFISKRMIRWGIGFLVVGFVMAFAAFHMENAGTRAIHDGYAKIQVVFNTFKNATATPSVGWGGLNIGQDLSSIYSDITTYGSDALNAISDLPSAIALTFTSGLPGALEVLAGAGVYGLGWVGEQTFAYLIFTGIVLVVIGLGIGLINFYMTNLKDYMRPRALIRNKAFKRRWLQRPLDPVVIPPSVIRRANEWNTQEALVNSIAYNENADKPAADALIADLKAAQDIHEDRSLHPELANGNEEEDVRRVLAEGKSIGVQGWKRHLVNRSVSVIMAVPSDETLRDSLLGKLAHKQEAKAVARITDSDGNLGVAVVGISENQTAVLGKYPNHAEYVLAGNTLVKVDIEDVDVEGPRRRETKTLERLETSDKTIVGGYVFEDLPLAFRWFNPAEPVSAAPPTDETPTAPAPPPPSPTTPAVPPPEPPAPAPEVELTAEQFDALTPEQQEDLYVNHPSRVPAEAWSRRAEGETLGGLSEQQRG